MKETEIKFGFWPQGSFNGVFHNHETQSFSIEALPEIQDIINKIQQDNQSGERWLYPPLIQSFDGKRKDGFKLIIPVSSFSIPATHSLKNKSCLFDNEFGYFIIAVLGLLVGLRLIPEGWNHFYRVAIKPFSLTDLTCDRHDIEHVLNQAECFWHANPSPEIRKNMFGAIHWFLFSQSYHYEFEEFGAQYTVLDTCWKLHCDLFGGDLFGGKSPSHAERPKLLAEYYGIPVPPWVEIRKDGKKSVCDLSIRRNEFIHEGRYDGHPIGFSASDASFSIKIQLQAFNSRLILGLLGVNCGYVRSSVTSLMTHSLCLD